MRREETKNENGLNDDASNCASVETIACAPTPRCRCLGLLYLLAPAQGFVSHCHVGIVSSLSQVARLCKGTLSSQEIS
jgi:hypothetical protein